MSNFIRKKSIYTKLVFAFTLSLFVMITVSTIAFQYITNSEEVDRKLIENIDMQNLTIEEKAEKIIGTIELRLLYILIGGSVIGTILMITAGRYIIKPIKDITKATKEVSAGNFDIDLKIIREDEIGELTNNFNKMAKELKNIEYLRKDFTNNVSHEFKTPIASIQGFTKLLKSSDLSEEERAEYIDIIIEETDRLSNLSSNILKLSSIENQEIIVNKKEFSLDEQIRKSVLILENRWSKKNIDFKFKLIPLKVYADEELLYQVWVNLLDNAIKFSNDNGKIEIKMYLNENIVDIEIKDNGIGIEESKKERIFEKFYQTDSSHSQDGSGLGLAIVKRIIKLSEGNIEVKSKIGEGTSFKISLPIR